MRRNLSARRVAFASATLGAAALLAFAACFSEHQATTEPNLSGDCRIPVGSPILGTTRALVAIRNFAFQPEVVRITAGTTITWVNCEPEGVEPHTSTSDAGVWNSGTLPPEAIFSHTFENVGRFEYFCVPHPFMRGVVVVE